MDNFRINIFIQSLKNAPETLTENQFVRIIGQIFGYVPTPVWDKASIQVYNALKYEAVQTPHTLKLLQLYHLLQSSYQGRR